MKNTVTLLSLLALCGLVTHACAQETSPATSTVETVSATPVQQTPAEAADEAEVSLMDTPLDGSSVEAFEAGVAAIETEVSASEFTELQSSLESMLFYNMSFRGKKEAMYKALDGKSPNEIIAMSKR